MGDHVDTLSLFDRTTRSVRTYDFVVYVSDIGADNSIVFVHGWLGDASGFSLVAEQLIGHLNIALISLPGHGESTPFRKSDGECDFDIDLYIEALDDVVGMVEGRPWLVGHSMGGAIIQEYLRTSSKKIAGAVLVNTTTTFKSAVPKHINDVLVMSVVEIKLLRELLADFFLDRAFHRKKDDRSVRIKRRLREQLMSIGEDEVVCPYKKVLTVWSGEDEMFDRDIPMLIIAGGADILVPRSKVRKMADLYPGSKFVVIDGATHLLPMSHFEELSEIIMEFVGSAVELLRS